MEKRFRELPEVDTGLGARVGKSWLAFMLITDV